MSAKRLSQEDRDDIYTELALRAFGARREEVEDLRDELANAVYNDLYPPATLKKMKSLPEGWLAKDTDVQVKIAGAYLSVYFRKGRGKNRTSDTRIMAFSHIRGCVAIYDGGSPIAELYERFLKIKTDLENEEQAARAEGYAALNRATTLRQLIEAWPDIEPIAKKVFGSLESSTMPVVAVEKLNERFKLPVPKGKKA